MNEKRFSLFAKWLSWLMPRMVETSQSAHNPRLEVELANGKLMLNTEKVNYAFGKLDEVWRSAFEQVKLKERKIHSVLVLGLGPGNIPAILAPLYPAMQFTGVEIDKEVIRLGKKYFGLGRYEHLKIVEADAVNFVKSCAEKFDLVCVDLFIDEVIPSGAERNEFVKHCLGLLNPGGLFLFNRLMHKPALAKASIAFTDQLKTEFPGLQTIKAGANRVIVIEADSRNMS